MESRKAWRNRDPSAAEGVLALLEALGQGLGAEGVGLFDDDRADPEHELAALNFWDAFAQRPCAEIDWVVWYRELRKDERVETPCGCGEGHRVCGFLIHGRWALLLVAAATVNPTGPAAIASSLRALAAMLPPARTAEERELLRKYDPEPEPPPEAGGRPVWWVRKLPH